MTLPINNHEDSVDHGKYAHDAPKPIPIEQQCFSVKIQQAMSLLPANPTSQCTSLAYAHYRTFLLQHIAQLLGQNLALSPPQPSASTASQYTSIRCVQTHKPAHGKTRERVGKHLYNMPPQHPTAFFA